MILLFLFTCYYIDKDLWVLKAIQSLLFYIGKSHEVQWMTTSVKYKQKYKAYQNIESILYDDGRWITVNKITFEFFKII